MSIYISSTLTCNPINSVIVQVCRFGNVGQSGQQRLQRDLVPAKTRTAAQASIAVPPVVFLCEDWPLQPNRFNGLYVPTGSAKTSWPHPSSKQCRRHTTRNKFFTSELTK